MKKCLKILLIISSIYLIFNFSNVSAATAELTDLPEKIFDYVHFINTKDMKPSEISEMMRQLGYRSDLIGNYIDAYLSYKNYIIANQEEGKYYFFAPDDGFDSYGVFHMSVNYTSRLFLNLKENGLKAYFGISKSRGALSYSYNVTFNVRVSNSDQVFYNMQSDDNHTIIKSLYGSQWITKVEPNFISAGSNYGLIHQYFFYDTNMDIDIEYLSDTGNWTGDLTINGTSYSCGSTLPFNTLTGASSEYLYEQLPPKITLKKEEETENYLKLLINFDKWDTSKYKYFYKINTSGSWVEIQENDTEYTAIKNDTTIYALVLDKETFDSTNDYNQGYITSSTLTISGLIEIIPDLTFSEKENEACSVTLNAVKYTICKQVNMQVNYTTLDTYIWRYSFDKITWTDIYFDSTTLTIKTNDTTIYACLYDKSDDNKLINCKTLTVSGIDTLNEETQTKLNGYVKFSGEYNENDLSFDVKALFYNFDENNYNYYYYIAGNESWTQITSSDLDENSNYEFRTKTFKFYDDSYLHIKVEPKNGDNIATYSIKIDYFSENVSIKSLTKKVNDFIADLKPLMGKFFELLDYGYNKLDSNVRTFIVVILIVLLIAAIINKARGD